MIAQRHKNPLLRVARISVQRMLKSATNTARTVRRTPRWVDVWWDVWTEIEESSMSLLSPAERARWEKIAMPERAGQFTAARVLLRRCLARYLGCEAAQVPIVLEKWGKPALAMDPHLFFNLSHTDGGLVLAVSDEEVGVDVESRPLPVAVPRWMQSKVEDTVGRMNNPQRLRRMWVRNEALLKAMGRGFADTREPPKISTGEQAEQMVVDCEGQQWYLTDLSIPISPFAALAVKVRGEGSRDQQKHERSRHVCAPPRQ